MNKEEITSQFDACFSYFSMMLANGLTTGKEKGNKYLMVFYDLINNNGIIEPQYSQVYINDLNDIFRLYKQGNINLDRVYIFNIETEEEVNIRDIFKKGE